MHKRVMHRHNLATTSKMAVLLSLWMLMDCSVCLATQWLEKFYSSAMITPGNKHL